MEGNNQMTIELTTTTDKKLISQAWAQNLSYRNINLFQKYMKFLDWLNQGTNCSELKADRLKDRDLQESYLGYVPSKDMFITGFDMWEGDDNPAGIAKWIINDNQSFRLIDEEIDYGSDMMYGKNGAYHMLHSKYHDLIDIRLD